jgi:hypothetical protein
MRWEHDAKHFERENPIKRARKEAAKYHLAKNMRSANLRYCLLLYFLLKAHHIGMALILVVNIGLDHPEVSHPAQSETAARDQPQQTLAEIDA